MLPIELPMRFEQAETPSRDELVTGVGRKLHPRGHPLHDAAGRAASAGLHDGRRALRRRSAALDVFEWPRSGRPLVCPCSPASSSACLQRVFAPASDTRRPSSCSAVVVVRPTISSNASRTSSASGRSCGSRDVSRAIISANPSGRSLARGADDLLHIGTTSDG